MADLTITAASVSLSSGTSVEGTAGETITAGQSVYRDASDSNKIKKADANASSATATVYGIALNGASNTQPIKVATSGTIIIGATTVKGELYVCSATAGGIAPEADLASGHYVSFLGIATDTTGTIKLGITNSGAQL